MSSGKNPLMLMMALTMPGAAHALGLGDIHVDSALNERFAAEIDLVGATALDLIDLRAAVANRETFLRFGADRPAFLSSTTFKVTQDSQGRPVLAVRSTESFTEPFVNFLVELRWGKGEILRQYTLLLDPPGFASASRAAPADRASTPQVPAAPDVPAAPAAATPIVETKTQTVARQVDPPTDRPDTTRTEGPVRKTTHIKVGAKATLRGIAWRVGERSDTDLKRMMIAIFRANPTAFDGNINRLYRGAVLTIPSHSELQAISHAEARREFHAQMLAWRAPGRAVVASSVIPAEPVLAKPVLEKPAADALDRRVQSLEQELNEMKGLLQSENEQLLSLSQQAARTESPAAPEAPQPVTASQAPSKSGYSVLVPMLAGLGILASAFAALYFGLRRRLPALKDSRSGAAVAANSAADEMTDDDMADTVVNVPEEEWHAPSKNPSPERPHDGAQDRGYDGTETDVLPTPSTSVDEATQPSLPVVAAKPAGPEEITSVMPRPAAHDTTVNQRLDAATLRMDQTRLDYNLLDLDLTSQHVHMPSVLNEPTALKERRTNLADVLLLAIEREPDRHDLRMKLLELYYAAAATNRQAFLDVVQKFARERDYLQADQWDKIARMGRQIASENPLFAEPVAEDDLADCA